MTVLAKTMEHVTVIWKTTLVLVLRNLPDKTVKVCLCLCCFLFAFSITVLVLLFSPLLAVKYHCQSSPCQNNGTCVNLHNNYTCNCPEGSSGLDCDGKLIVK